MSYTISINEQETRVTFLGHIDGLDLTQLHKDPVFVTGWRKKQKLILNFSHAKSIQLKLEHINGFARLAHIEAQFSPVMHLVIIPKNFNQQERARYYQNLVNICGWQVDIVRDIDAAKTIRTPALPAGEAVREYAQQCFA